MTQEDLDTFGKVPTDRYFQSERDAPAFYEGDAMAATIFEASPQSQPYLYSSVCDMVSKREVFADAVRMAPDLAGARAVARLTTSGLAQVLEIPHADILQWERGRRPLPTAVALPICKAFCWPLAILFRSRTAWYPRTKCAKNCGDSELPF